MIKMARGYDPDKYGTMLSGLRLKGATQEIKEPTWVPLQSSAPNSYAPQSAQPVGYGRQEMPQGIQSGVLTLPDNAIGSNQSIAGMLGQGQSNDAIRDLILRKMIYGG